MYATEISETMPDRLTRLLELLREVDAHKDSN
jgi:hypothetical protein